MAACDQISKYIQRVTGSGAGGAVPIIFPTAFVAMSESVNTTVATAAGASTLVLAANANRKFAQIVNNTGNLLRISIGGAAAATDLEFPNQSVYKLEGSTIGGIPLGDVFIWNPTGAPLSVTVQELQ